MHNTARMILDAGYCTAVAIILLQISTTYIPIGETRDQLQYVLVAFWAVLYLSTAVLLRTYPPAWGIGSRSAIIASKTLLTAYAFIILTRYFVLPLLQLEFWWLWMGAFCIALRCGNDKKRLHPLKTMGILWGLLCIFSLSFSLLYQDQKLTFPTAFPTLYYAIPFLAGLVFVADVLCRKIFHTKIINLPALLQILLHLIALYTLLIAAFRFESIGDGVVIHHWKAFLESAESLRAGGWLLWDVPSQYGFLQTLIIAFLPTPDCWQALYILNGSLQMLIGYGIFAVLFARYRSIGGYFLSLSLASACIMLTLPSTVTQEIYPSTGALRFFWVYAMAGYVFFLCKLTHCRQGKPLPNHLMFIAHTLWLVGVFWAVDSAIYVTIIWLPSLVILALSEACAGQGKPPALHIMARHIAIRLLPALLMAAMLSAVILAAYWAHYQQFPDWVLLTGYTFAYQTFMAYPITAMAILPCWLGIFYMLVILLKNELANSIAGQQSGLHLAALYSAAFSIWVCAGYYVPFSENFHLTGTLPLLVFASALTLQLLPVLALPDGMKLVFEKAALCLYAVVLLGTLSHFDYRMYTQRNFLFPIETHISRLLPQPPEDLQALIAEAAIPEGSSVQIIYDVYGLEAYHLPIQQMKPWLLPNTMVAFRMPLAPEIYQRAAERRAETSTETGWVIEAEAFPLEALPWLNTAIAKHYTQISVIQKGIWHIRKFRKNPIE